LQQNLSFLQMNQRKNGKTADKSYLPPERMHTGQKCQNLNQSDVIGAKNILKFSASFGNVTSTTVTKMTSDGRKFF